MEIDLGYWNSQPNSGVDNTKPDLRIESTPHGNLVCTCSALNINNTYAQTQCRWYYRRSYDKQAKTCRYDRFGIMCDKVLDKDGKGVN